jgi:hypothetical protein
MTSQATAGSIPGIGVQFWRLTKPRVVSLIVFTAVIGMLLAVPDGPPPGLVLSATIGIALVAGAAAAFNCLVEQKIDAAMARTRPADGDRHDLAGESCCSRVPPGWGSPVAPLTRSNGSRPRPSSATRDLHRGTKPATRRTSSSAEPRAMPPVLNGRR